MRESILREFRGNTPAVHAQKGSSRYGPAVDTPDFGKIQTQFGPDTFVVIEKWESVDALKAHAASPAYGRLRRQDQGHDRQSCHPRPLSCLSIGVPLDRPR